MSSISTELFDCEILAQEGEKVPLWNVRPFQLVSLLEMLEHNAYLFFILTRGLLQLQIAIECEINERGGMSPLTDKEIRTTENVIDSIRRACIPIQLGGVLHRLSRFNEVNFQPSRGTPFSLEQLRIESDNLVEEITRALSQNKFMMIPNDKAEYYDKPELFGEKVYTNFKSTRDDVAEIGNCYAAGRNTACVFHCMRVLEKGLHALVHDLNNRFSAGIVFKKEIEATNWGNIIAEIQNTLTLPKRQEILNPKPTSQDVTFYAMAAREFEHFNDAWRKNVSHSRRSYDENEAKAVMVHVHAFMELLASGGLHE